MTAGCGDAPDDESAAALSGGGPHTGGAPPDTDFPDGYIVLGNLETFPPGTVVPVGSLSLLVGRDELGVYAMTSICTHEQCEMINNDGTSGSGITTCGCHGSVFDPNGVPTKGPASQPLQHFDVLIDDNGYIAVNPTIPVDIDQRAPA